MTRLAGIAFVVALLVAACAPAGSGAGGGGTAASQTPTGPRIVHIGLDEDMKHYWESLTAGGGSGAREMAHLLNQHLAAIDGEGNPHPRLLAELPSQDRGTWRVNADGTMETTWRIRPNIFWHDGTPFTVADLAFSWEVNRDREVPNSNQEAVRLIQRVEEQDAHTAVAYWTQLYAFADRLEHRELFTLPKHLLEKTYRESKEQFLNNSYFSTGYVGLGPFRVTKWEFGSGIEGAAFDQFFLGRPKLDLIRVRFIADNSTMLANLRARELQMMLTLGNGPAYDSMVLLKQEWEAAGYGTMYADPISWLFVEPQKVHNPQPADLTDLRVRQALLHTIDRENLVQATTADSGRVADSWVHPSFKTYGFLEQSMTKYPYDLRRASELFSQAGWRPGSDGVLEKNGQRFAPQARSRGVEREGLIVLDSWKRAGVAGEVEAFPDQMLRDTQARATFTGFDITSNPMGAAAASRRFAGYNIPTAENRWVGTNRGGFTHTEWDDLDRRVSLALDDRVRLELEKDLVRIFTAELPVLPLTYKFDTVPIGGGLTGVQPVTNVAHRGFILHTWNSHEWDVRQN